MTLLAGALAPLADCWNHGGGPWFLLIPFFWIAVIVFVIWLFRRRRWGRPHHWPRASAVELLEGRFARGEIDAEEYRARRSVLAADEQDK